MKIVILLIILLFVPCVQGQGGGDLRILSRLAYFKEVNRKNETYKVYLFDRGETVALNRYQLKVYFMELAEDGDLLKEDVVSLGYPIETVKVLPGAKHLNLLVEVQQVDEYGRQSKSKFLNLELSKDKNGRFSFAKKVGGVGRHGQK